LGNYLIVEMQFPAEKPGRSDHRLPADGDFSAAGRPAEVSPHGPDPRRVCLCEALIELVAEQGYRSASVTKIIQRAGLSEADFAIHFADKHQCAERVWAEMSDAFIAGLGRASDPPGPWLERIRRASDYTLDYFEADISRSTFFIIGSLATGEVAQARRDLVVASAIDLIDEGRLELSDPDSLDRSTAEGVAGALYEAIVKAVGEGDVRVGRTLLPQLMYIVVLPYLGPEAAERQMARAEAEIARR
jgi:AcrR family transcriptional regulator